MNYRRIALVVISMLIVVGLSCLASKYLKGIMVNKQPTVLPTQTNVREVGKAQGFAGTNSTKFDFQSWIENVKKNPEIIHNGLILGSTTVSVGDVVEIR